LVEAGTGIDQSVACHHHPLLDDDKPGNGTLYLGLNGQDLIADGRNPALRRAAAIGGFIDQLERHLGGLAEGLFQMFRIAQPRHLHQYPVVALALDRGLARSHFIDAPAYDFDRLVHDVGLGLSLVGIGDFQRECALTVVGKIVSVSADAEHARSRGWIQSLDQCSGLVALRRIFDENRKRARGDADPVILDVCLAQRAAHIAHERFKLVLLDGIEFDFEQQIGAALQVQTERHRLARQPARKPGADVVRQRIGNRHDEAGEEYQRDGYSRPK